MFFIVPQSATHYRHPGHSVNKPEGTPASYSSRAIGLDPQQPFATKASCQWRVSGKFQPGTGTEEGTREGHHPCPL